MQQRLALHAEAAACISTAQDARLRRLFERRAGIECRRTPQIARLRLIVRPTAMHRAAIVPDDQIADPPLMAVDELALRRVRIQIPQQQAPFGHRPAGMCDACAER